LWSRAHLSSGARLSRLTSCLHHTPLALITSRVSSLLSLEIFIVGGLTAATFLSRRLLPLPVVAFVVFALLRLVAERRLLRRTPLDPAILLLVLMIPVTLWATALPEVTVPQIWRLLDGVALYYATAHWGAHTPERFRWLLRGVLLAGVGIAATAPFSVTWSASKLRFIPAGVYQRFSVLVSDTVHPNVMGGNVAMFLPLSAALLLFDWKTMRWWERVAVGLAGVFMGGVLVLTKSRGAWMGTLLALGLLLVLRWRWWGLAAGLLGAGAAAWGVQNTLGWNALWQSLAASGVVSGLDGRIDIWSRAVYMLQDFPFTGVGMGAFGPLADLLYPFFLAAPGKIVHAHNLFLQIGVDLGIPGLIAWLAGWLGVMWMGWRLYRTAPAALARAAGAGVLLSQVVVGVHGLFDAVVWGQIRSAPLLWLLWGLAAAALNLSADGEETEA